MKESVMTKLLDCSAATLLAALFTLVSITPTSAQAPRRLVTQEINETQRVTLRGNVHPWARAEFDQGAITDTRPVNRIYLLLNRTPEQQAALDKLMREQMDANSPNYHNWLTPEQYGAQFGPADADVEVVKSWLSSQGFTGIKTNAGKTIVEFNGTVGTVRRAFSTELHSYMVRGEKHFANVRDPQIPSALAGIVAGIPSLHNFRKQSHVKRIGKFRRDLTTGEIRPLFTFADVNGTFFGMGPADFAKIYNIPAGADGTGQSIAIVGRSNINIQDVRDFRTMFGLPANDPVIILNGADPGVVSGDEVEADLDVEWSGAVAPNATIKFVVSEQEQTDAVDAINASAQFIIDNNIAPVMSVSFGLCEAQESNALINAMWQQAAAEGITVTVSTGDSGSAGCDDPNSENSATKGIAISGTASTPFNVAVGGTDFDDATTQTTFWGPTNGASTQLSALGYIPEIPWNDSCGTAGLTGCNTATTANNLNIVAASGGPSSIYTKTQAPFQAGFGDATARDIPDISLFASDGLNKSFYIICESDQDISGDSGCNLTKFVTASPFHDFQAVGGTSASTPAFAGIMALVNQKTGQRQGNANFVLYSLFKTEQALATFTSCNSSSFTAPGTQPSFCVFMDVSKSNNAVPCVGGSTNCSKTTTGGNGVLQRNNAPAFAAGTGYDLATGLGSINVTALLSSWPANTKPIPTITISPANITSTLGTLQVLTGTITSGSGTPTGEVVIENAATGIAIDSATISGNTYSVSTTLLPAAPTPYQVKAHYGGDANFAPSDSTTMTTVNITQQTSNVIVSFVNASNVPVTTPQTVAYGSPYILRVDVENSGGKTCAGTPVFACPTGTVALLDGVSPLKDFPNAQTLNATNVARLNNRGFVEDQPVQLPVGAHTITATYAADASSSFTSSNHSNTLSVTIMQATTTTGVSASPSVTTSGGTVVLTATVSTTSNSTIGPTGTVQFSNGSTTIGAAVTCVSKGADLTKTPIVPALCTATLSTPISFFVPTPSPNNRRIPFEWLAALLALAAMALLLLSTRLQKPRRAYAYAAITLFLIASATLAGCSGSGSSSGGGGNARTISAKYSGDTNYATSTGTGSVTIQ
jgi:subtilase family serine protease